MSQIYIAEVTAYDPALPGEKVLRFCTGTGYTSGAGDTPAHAWHEPRIQQPANMQRALPLRGASRVGYGELVLVNLDGGLDDLVEYGFDGRQIAIKLGTLRPWQSPVWTTVLQGTMARADFSWSQLTISLRDRMAELDKPLQSTAYAGNNSLPNGAEGVAGDLKGKPKPRLYGNGYNLAPPCVNTSRLIYQISDTALQAVSAVYDRGAALTAGAAYSSQSDMETNAPSAGQYRVWLAGGMFRLGSAPVGQITCDAVQGATSSNRTAAQVAKQTLLDAGIASGDISSSDVTALDTATSAEVGLWVNDANTARAALDTVLGSVGGWWGVDRLGQFRMARLDAPSGSPVATLTEVEIIKIDRIASADAAIPVWRVNLGYQPFATTQTSDLAGAVTAARRGELAEPYRKVTASDSSVQTLHPLAETMDIETAISSAAAAQTEADRLLALYKVRRDTLSLRVALDASLAAAIDLGAVVSVQVPRYGYDSGRLMRVTSIRTDLRGGVLDLTLWG
jgi:hypothetical protein